MSITDKLLSQINSLEEATCVNTRINDSSVTQLLDEIKEEIRIIDQEHESILERRNFFSAQVSQQYGIIEALSEGSTAIYVITLDNQYIIPIKRQSLWDVIEQPEGGVWGYNEKLQHFINQNVYPDDQRALQSLLNFEHLSEIISTQTHYYHHFRMLLNGEIHYFYVKITRVQSTSQHLDGIMLSLICEDESKERESLRTLSETDIMTNLYNRGTGEKKVRELIESDVTGMFCIMDMDHFKSINDTLGHSVGDQVLIAFAQELKAAFRDEDIVFRLGGDEFAVFAPGILSRRVGMRILKSFINRVKAINIPELNGLKPEISIGATLTGNPDITFEDIYTQTDACVYTSKKDSGNAITFYPDRKAIVV